jgi:GTP cyclohydrolase III
VKVGQELARAQTDQIIAAQRDNVEVQEKLQDLLEAFTQYLGDQNALARSATFQAVVRDIQKVSRDYINPSTY